MTTNSRVPEFYSEDEKKQKAERILQLFGNGYKPLVDKIEYFAELASNDLQTVEIVVMEDVSSKAIVKHVREFSNIKKSAKYKALNMLVDIIRFEENIVRQFAEEEKKYLEKGIGSRFQLKKFRLKNKKKKKVEKSEEAEKTEKEEIKAVETSKDKDTKASDTSKDKNVSEDA